jgi:geranylgeranyl diphosphate synthase type I
MPRLREACRLPIDINLESHVMAVSMASASEMLQSLGEPIVNEAFDDLFASGISSPTAKRVLRRFAKRWRDYTRAALLVMACEAVGGDPALVRPAAKGLVLAGGAFDLHDDVIDRSFVRKKGKKKTIQGIYGADAALLAGDALLIGGLMQLTDMPGVKRDVARRAISVIREGLYELGSAEMEELRFVRNLDASSREYLGIIRMKGADVESYTRVGAIIGGGTEAEAESLGRFGRCLGIICILRDDLEDTFNDMTELRSRLMKESLPLPVRYCVSDPRCRSLLNGIWSREEGGSPTDQELKTLIEIIDAHQGFEKGQRLIDRYVRQAKRAVQDLRDPAPFVRLFH